MTGGSLSPVVPLCGSFMHQASSVWMCLGQRCKAFVAAALDLARPAAEMSLGFPDCLWEGRQGFTNSSFVSFQGHSMDGSSTP